MNVRRAIGIGCASDATVDDVLDLVRETIGDAGATALATIDRRAAIGRAVAAKLRLPLVLFDADVLNAVAGIQTPSARAAATVDTASVAEASALAALGPGARLLVARRTGRRATCALAEFP